MDEALKSLARVQTTGRRKSFFIGLKVGAYFYGRLNLLPLLISGRPPSAPLIIPPLWLLHTKEKSRSQGSLEKRVMKNVSNYVI